MNGRAYYNEFDPFAAQWLRNLIAAGHIAAGDVDERSIADVRADDVRGYTQCHFFAGIGGWSLALRLAGVDDSRHVWSGSCPCQPFSPAGARKGFDDPRHLWPEWRRLIAECTPPVVFGEQVASARAWLDGVCSDMAADGYTFDALVLPAYCFGFDHARERIYFASHANDEGEPRLPLNDEMARVPRYRGIGKELALEDGLSRRMVAMRAYGNSLVPAVAAAFIRAVMECRP